MTRLACPLLLLIASSALAAPGAPRELRCEHQRNPLGLDAAEPRFSWQMVDISRGACQTAWQLQVATSRSALLAGRALLWDSGRVESGDSHLVEYAGPPLSAASRYWWRVRTWGATGSASPWSDVAWWEMGLLSPADWSASWISPVSAASDPFAGASWIWAAEGDHAFIRGVAELPEGGVRSATLHVDVDNRYTVYLNGVRLGDGDEWETPEARDVAALLEPGRNVVVLEAWNEDGPKGAVVSLDVTLTSGEVRRFVSDDSWRAAPWSPAGWHTRDFADGDWPRAAVVAQWGDGPWGRPGQPAGNRSSLLRKGFSLSRKPVSARAYVTGLGVYELHLNGEKIGEEYLTPGWTHYRKRIQYRVYDVTDSLRAGDNAVGAILGNGWWGSTMAGAWQDGPPCLLFELRLRYADGSEERIVSDESWTSSPSAIVNNSLYHGEIYDARLEQSGWDAADFAPETDWTPVGLVERTKGTLVAQLGPPIRKTAERRPDSVTQVRPGVWVYDFGQNITGWCRLRASGPAGTEITLRHAEVLNADGTIYTDNLRSARATDRYTLSGSGEAVWEPTFTYHGFRYAELTGFPGTPDADTLTACVVHSAPEEIGAFRSPDETIEHVEANTLWGLRANLYSVPTDCPQRDERLGWTGDAEAFAPTALWRMDLAPMLEKWLRDLADSQRPDGAVTDVAPCLDWGPAAPAWGDVVTIVPWTVWERTGDRRILEENYPVMRRWVEYMRSHAPSDLYGREGYGDWVAVEGTPSKPLGTEYYYLSTRILADTARVLGNEADAQEYSALAGRIRDAFNAAYFDEATNSYPGGTQTANVLPLAFGLVPEGREAAVAENVRANVAAHGDHLTTGFLGTGLLLPMLSDWADHQQAWRVATQRTYPSWGYMVEQGATTIWELWNSDTAGPGMNSRNHFCLGGVGEWLFTRLAGLRPDPDGPGFRRFVVEPMPVEGLPWAEARYRSAYGSFLVRWERAEDGGLDVRIEAPANTSGRVRLPAATLVQITEGGRPALEAEGVRFSAMRDGMVEFEIGSGRYVFHIAPR